METRQKVNSICKFGERLRCVNCGSHISDSPNCHFNQKRVSLVRGASARVSPGVSDETINALNKMVESAYQMTLFKQTEMDQITEESKKRVESFWTWLSVTYGTAFVGELMGDMVGKWMKEYDIQDGDVEPDRLQSLMNWNYEWAKEVFPKHAKSPVPPLEHLKEEVLEIIDAINNNSPLPELLEEYADALILLTGSARRKGITSKQIIDAAYEKMQKNVDREWGEPDENGVYKHKD